MAPDSLLKCRAHGSLASGCLLCVCTAPCTDRTIWSLALGWNMFWLGFCCCFVCFLGGRKDAKEVTIKTLFYFHCPSLFCLFSFNVLYFHIWKNNTNQCKCFTQYPKHIVSVIFVVRSNCMPNWGSAWNVVLLCFLLLPYLNTVNSILVFDLLLGLFSQKQNIFNNICTKKRQ